MKRNSLVFKDRLSLDDCDVSDLSEFEKRRDPSMQRAFKLRCLSRNKCYVLAARSVDEKNQWLATFSHLQHQHHLQQHQQHQYQHQHHRQLHAHCSSQSEAFIRRRKMANKRTKRKLRFHISS